MDNCQIYNLININKFKIFNSNKKDERLNNFLKEQGIILPISQITVKSVYDYLTESKNKFCSICGNENIFKGFVPGYSKFCSKSCLYLWRSSNMIGENNNIHKISLSAKKEMGRKISKHIKEKIIAGTFTPNITNSWCHSKIIISIKRNNKNINVKCRSSWDAFFQLKHPDYLYEKIRIPYFFNSSYHSFIVDFVNIKDKIIYVIKPDSEKLTPKNIAKFNTAKKWSIDNGYKFKIISNEWFIANYNEGLIIGQPEEEILKKRLKQFL